MKYLITESQQENVIKKFILSNFNRVTDVIFETKSIHYGSGPVNGKTNGIRTDIICIVDNTNPETELNNVDLLRLRKEIIRLTNRTFNLNYDRYGSEWGFVFMKKVLEQF
jgi:hypothetical protein